MRFYEFDAIAEMLDGSWQRPPTVADHPPCGVVIDSRESLDRKMFIAIRGERFDGHDFICEAAERGAALVLIESAGAETPDVPTLRVQCCREALRRLASQYRKQVLSDVTVIAITGSCGKTTTKSLVDAALGSTLSGRAAIRSFNNEIGVPLTILGASATDDYLIVELGTNAPGEIAHLAQIAAPDVSIVTMVGLAHLEGLGSADAIRREKLSLLTHTNGDGTAFVHHDIAVDDVVCAARIETFGCSPSATTSLSMAEWTGEAMSLTLRDGSQFTIPLPGEHNAINALPAIAVARRLGCADSAIQQGLRHIRKPPMRFEETVAGGVRFINDAYNANPQSMRASLSTFADVVAAAGRRICVLGDMLELGGQSAHEHDELLDWIDRNCAKWLDELWLIGCEFAAALARRNESLVKMICIGERCSAEVAARVRDSLRRGDAILLKGSRSIRLESILTSADEVAAVT